MDQLKCNKDLCTKEMQEARSLLRERFIRAVMSMNAKPGTFHMYENTKVSATFGSPDREFSNIHVKNLQTPLGPLANAVLRTNDIFCIQFPDINPS